MPQPSSSRALPLDALRGLAIFMMILSSAIPFHVLPDWMYHAQVPPPAHAFVPTLPGITWVDLVFPFFLFSMGAAIPMALTRRLDQGIHRWKVLAGLLERGALLAAFAIYDEHIRPWRFNGSTENIPPWINAVGLLGFALLLPMFMQYPRSMPRWGRIGARIAGWGGAAIFLALCRYPDGTGFSLYRSDIIILVLANMAVVAGLLWIATQTAPTLRLGLLGLLFALRVSSGTEGWIHDLWVWSPAPWLFQFHFLKYLFLLIPGTIVGDLYLAWMRSREGRADDTGSRPRCRLTLMVLLLIALPIVLVIGLKARLILASTAAAVVLLGIGFCLFRNAVTPLDRFLRTLFGWGAYLIGLGLLFEPFEGGIKKDPSTMSYYFVTGGLAICALIVLVIVIEIFRQERKVRLFIECGQNPLVAYAGINNLVRPILALTGIGALLDFVLPTPWLGVLKGVIVTVLTCWLAALCTRGRIFLKT